MDSQESSELERNLGPQPIADILEAKQLTPGDLVDASPVQMTRKMVTRACKGRRLTPHSKRTVLQALNVATNEQYTISDIFNY